MRPFWKTSHAVAQMLDDAEIMRDEQQRRSEPRLELGQEIEHLGLDADVERRDRLVADDDGGFSR
ncbi:hypothetical protein ACVW0J_007373 [Bradyrhizobium sp. i1.7.7]